jgi:hypothetical protein
MRQARRKEFIHSFGQNRKARDHLGDLTTDGKTFKKYSARREEHSSVSELGPVAGHMTISLPVHKRKRIWLIQRLTVRLGLSFIVCFTACLSQRMKHVEPHNLNLVFGQDILIYKLRLKLMVYFHTTPLQRNMLTHKIQRETENMLSLNSYSVHLSATVRDKPTSDSACLHEEQSQVKNLFGQFTAEYTLITICKATWEESKLKTCEMRYAEYTSDSTSTLFTTTGKTDEYNTQKYVFVPRFVDDGWGFSFNKQKSHSPIYRLWAMAQHQVPTQIFARRKQTLQKKFTSGISHPVLYIWCSKCDQLVKDERRRIRIGTFGKPMRRWSHGSRFIW